MDLMYMNASAWILLLAHSLRMLTCLIPYLPWPIPCRLSLFLPGCGVVGYQRNSKRMGRGEGISWGGKHPLFPFPFSLRLRPTFLPMTFLRQIMCVEYKVLTDQSFISILFYPIVHSTCCIWLFYLALWAASYFIIRLNFTGKRE